MVDAVLSVAVDPSGVEQGARVVRRSLEDIDRSANSSMSAMDRYNATLGKGASAAEIFQRQMKVMEAQVKAADDAFRAQSRAVEELNFRFDIVRSAAKDVVAGLQQIGKTKFTGDIVADINRLSTDMTRIMDAGGKGAVTAARAAQKEMLAYARAHLDQQLALVKEEAQKRIAGAQAEWVRIKELHKGAKTEIAAQERAAAEQALEIAAKAATDSVAAAKSASAGIIADMEARSNQLITIKKEENRVAADLVRADEQLKRTTTELDGSLNRLLATEQQRNAMLVATEASEKRLNDLAGQVVEREKKKTVAIDATTTSLKEQMALQIPNGYAPVSNASLASSFISAPPSPPTPPSPPPEDPEEIERLLAIRQKLLASYDWETLALDRRDDALEKLSLLRQKNIIDDDEAYERLRRRITGEEEAARQQAQAAERAAVENDRLAASYKSVMASIDPAVAAQQRYDAALKNVLDYHRSVHSSTAEMAADMDHVKAALSPAAVAAREEAAALQALEDRLDKSGAAARRMAEEQARLDGARDRGDLSPERHAALTKVLNEEGAAHQNAARGAVTHMRAAQLLVPQLSDVFTTAAMGMDPLMILIQQGPQIVDVFLLAGKEAALAAARFALMASPIIAIGAAFVGVIYAVQSYRAEVKEVERINALVGQSAGMTTTALLRQAEAVGDAAGISTDTARDIQNAYLGTGKIGGAVLADLTASTKGWALATAQDVESASDDLAKLFSDPSKAVDELTTKYGVFDDAQRQLIKNYQAQGNLERAQALLLQGIEDRAKAAAERMSDLGKAWEWIKKQAADGVEWVGEAAGQPSRQKRIETLQLQQAGGIYLTSGMRQSDAEELAALEQLERDDSIQAWAAGVRADFVRTSNTVGDFARSVDPAQAATTNFANAQKLVNDAVAKYPELQEQGNRALALFKAQLLDAMDPAKAFALEMERQGKVAEAAAGRARDFEQQRQAILQRRGAQPGDQLTAQEMADINIGLDSKYTAQSKDNHRIAQEAIQDARLLAAAQASASSAAVIAAQAQIAYNKVIRETTDATHPLGDVQAAQQAKQDALTKGMIEFNAQVDASIANGQLAVASAQRLADAQARGGDIAMARARSENVLAEQLARGVDRMKALTLAALDYQKSLADLSAQQRAWNRDIADQIDAARRLAQAEAESGAAVAEANIQNRIRAQILKEGVDLDSARAQAIEAGTRALEAQNAAGRVNSSIRQSNQDLALARAEYDMLGMSNAERERSVAIMRAQLEVQNSGDWAQVPQETRDAWIAQAGAVAEYRSRVADATEASRDFASVIGKGFEDAVLAGGKLSDILKGLQSDIERIFLRATVTKPLENWLTGTMTKVLAPAPANDNFVQPVNDNDPGGYRALFEGLTGGKSGAVGSQGNPMWVRVASAGNTALDVSTIAAQAMSGPVPVAIANGGAIVDTIRAEARAQGVPEEVALAVAKIESGYRQHAADGRVLTSSAGAQGVMQLMPGTADWLGVDGTNTRENIAGGVKFLSMLGRQFGGNWTMAAAAYNTGPARAQAWQRGDASLPAETVAYIQKFTGAMQEAGTQATGVTRAMEDEMAARLDAVPVQRSSTAAQAEWTAAQRATIDAALGLTAANDDTAKSIEVVARPMDKLRENAISAAEAQGQAAKLNVQSARDMAQASQQSAMMMVGGTQQAVGGILSIVGALSGIKGGGIPGQVVAAGGPQGIMASVQQFGSALGEWAKKPLESLGLSGTGSIMDAKLFNLGGAPTAANGMIRGSESAMTAQGAGGAPGFTVGNALSTVGYGVNAFMNFKQGNVVGGIGNTAAAAMMFIPGAQAFAPLVAIGSSLLGGLFGGQKPSNREGNVSINFETGAATVGGQEGKKFSAENRQAAQGIGGQIQQLAATLEALLPGQQIKGRGLIAVGDRDGLRAEYGGQTQSFGEEDSAGLAAWFAKQFAADMKAGFERGDLPAQVADNLQVVLDRGVTSGVEQFVADLQLASTDFAKAFDAVGAAQPAQVAGAVTEVTQSFLAMRDRAIELGLAVDGLAESQKRATDRLIDAEIRSARGQNEVSSALAIRETFTKVAEQLLAAGQDGQKAVELYGAQMESLLGSMGDTAASLEAIIRLANAVRGTDPVAALWADTRAGQVRDKLLSDLDLRQQQASVQMLAGDPAQQQAAQDAYDMRALLLEQDRELRSVTDAVYRAKLLEVQATERQALAAQQAAKAQAELAAKQQALISAGGTVRGWLDQQRATAGTSVSPQDARDAAQAQFARDLALARGGDVEAYGRLTGAADRLLLSQEALTASGTETQTMRAWVMSSLENLPATKSYDQQMLEELRKLGGSVNVQVELTTVRVITEQLSALSDVDKAKLTQAAVVLRTVEERIGRFLTDAELGRLVDNALVTRDVQQTLGRDLTDAERTALVGGGDVLRTVEQQLGRTLTAVEVESIVQSGSVSRTIEQAIGRTLTAAEAASIVSAGAVTRDISQHLARNLSAPEVAALVVGGAVERMVTQQLGRDLTIEERAGLVTAATVIRSVEQQLGRPLTAAEQAAIILPGSVQRTIGQQIDPATGAVLVPGGTITRTVTQSVETTETVQISRSIDDKMSGILASIKEAAVGTKDSAAGMQKLLERAVDGDGLMVRTRPTGDPRQWVAFEQGGVVPGYENGGIVANGTPGRDSVVARGPGGMPIWLAGLEGILTAPATAAIGGKPTIDYINEHHALPGWGRVGYEAGGITPPSNDLWAPNVTPIRRQDYAPAQGRSGSDERTAAELRLLRQAVERLARILERNEDMDQEQRAKIAQQHADLLDRIADAAEGMDKKITGTGGF
ncbi:phage tail length tape measure family protein [Azospirillum sp. Marseille-Q6669]